MAVSTEVEDGKEEVGLLDVVLGEELLAVMLTGAATVAATVWLLPPALSQLLQLALLLLPSLHVVVVITEHLSFDTAIFHIHAHNKKMRAKPFITLTKAGSLKDD